MWLVATSVALCHSNFWGRSFAGFGDVSGVSFGWHEPPNTLAVGFLAGSALRFVLHAQLFAMAVMRPVENSTFETLSHFCRLEVVGGLASWTAP